MEKIEYSITGTFSLDSKTVDSLNELKKKFRVSKSELLRLFTDYFNENRDELKELIEDNEKE